MNATENKNTLCIHDVPGGEVGGCKKCIGELADADRERRDEIYGDHDDDNQDSF